MERQGETMNAHAPAPRISVAMATCNGEKFLREQLDSIARQTLPPMEIVITDDASTDSTLQIIQDFARHAPFPVRAYRNPVRLGYAENFLKAASLCNGDIIAFCDQDDIWQDHKCALSSQPFSDPAVSLVLHAAQLMYPDGKIGNTYPSIPQARTLTSGQSNPFENRPGFAMLFRSSLLRLVDNSHRPWRAATHDQWTWFLACCVGKIALVPDALAFYRQHENNHLGVPLHMGLNWGRIRSTTADDYASMAESEIEGARILVAAATHWPALAKPLYRSAKQLQLRARLHRLRSRLYSPSSNPRHRIVAYCRIAMLGGYLPDPSQTRMGFRAAIKDMVLGVAGLSRRLSSKASAAPQK